MDSIQFTAKPEHRESIIILENVFNVEQIKNGETL